MNQSNLINYNRNRIYHLPEKYESLNHYLHTPIRQTLLSILRFLNHTELIYYNNRYVFFMANRTLTYKIRRRMSDSVSNRHINLLCALNLLHKEYQYKDNMLEINKQFLEDNPDIKRPMNVFYLKKYTDRELQACEIQAARLQSAGVTSGNISYNYLTINGLGDVANRIYPTNNRASPRKKAREYGQILGLLDALTDTYGYATRQQIQDNMLLSETEIKRVLQIYRQDLREKYNFKRPSRAQIELYGLQDGKYIYTRKD